MSHERYELTPAEKTILGVEEPWLDLSTSAAAMATAAFNKQDELIMQIEEIGLSDSISPAVTSVFIALQHNAAEAFELGRRLADTDHCIHQMVQQIEEWLREQGPTANGEAIEP